MILTVPLKYRKVIYRVYKGTRALHTIRNKPQRDCMLAGHILSNC